MPWFRLDDSFHSHPKVIAAGNEAIGLYVRCGTYAAQHLTDGFVPEHVALLYGSPALADKLVSTRLWRRTRDGWRMRDYLEYNPSKDDVTERRKVRAEAGRKGGLASGKARSKPEANASARASPIVEPPSRSHPGPVADVVNRTNGGSGARASPEVIEAITKEILAVTGRHVTDEWAGRIAEQILQGRATASPAAYVRQAIRNDPDPRHRFLPLY